MAANPTLPNHPDTEKLLVSAKDVKTQDTPPVAATDPTFKTTVQEAVQKVQNLVDTTLDNHQSVSDRLYQAMDTHSKTLTAINTAQSREYATAIQQLTQVMANVADANATLGGQILVLQRQIAALYQHLRLDPPVG
jgi:flagellar hook-basal body complex protein FliE